MHTNLQMESCCVLQNSINGEYPMKKTIDFISWDLNETWNAIVHETVLNHVAAKILQLTPSELERNANTVQDRKKKKFYMLSNLVLFRCVLCMGKYGKSFHPRFLKWIFLSSDFNSDWSQF